MRGALVGLISGLFLFACTMPAGLPLSAEQRLQIACSSYADTLSSLALRNSAGMLTREQQSQVDQAVAAISPICSTSRKIEARDVLMTVERALITMIEAGNG